MNHPPHQDPGEHGRQHRRALLQRRHLHPPHRQLRGRLQGHADGDLRYLTSCKWRWKKKKSESCDCWSAKIYEAAIDWPISLTDSIGDGLSVLGLSEVDAGASHPSLSLLHYEASWIFPYAGRGKTQTLKWGLCRNSHELVTFMSLFFSTSLVWKLRATIQDVLRELNCIKGFSTYILTLYSLLILPNNTSGLDLSDAWCVVCSHSLNYLSLK